jgi:hypothetical protein
MNLQLQYTPFLKFREENLSVRKFRDEKVQTKCLTKPTGSENLRRAIDDDWERFERKEKGR